MKEKIQKISAVMFVGIFCTFALIVSKQSHYKSPLKYQPQFNQKFHGQALVIDGDSIKVDDGSTIREVRLFGIDAPEYSQTCFNSADKEYNCGQISKNFLFKLIHQKQVTCYYSQKDIYNRFLAKCEIDNISINQEILKNGMALIYDFNQSDDLMKDLEKSAKNKKLGIWQGKFQTPKDYRKDHPRN